HAALDLDDEGLVEQGCVQRGESALPERGNRSEMRLGDAERFGQRFHAHASRQGRGGTKTPRPRFPFGREDRPDAGVPPGFVLPRRKAELLEAPERPTAKLREGARFAGNGNEAGDETPFGGEGFHVQQALPIGTAAGGSFSSQA